MANRGVPAGILILLSAGVATALIVLATRAKAAVPPEIPSAEIPTENDIMNAQSIPELDAYYDLISELFIIGKLTHDEYMELYDIYYERYHQLVGVS